MCLCERDRKTRDTEREKQRGRDNVEIYGNTFLKG